MPTTLDDEPAAADQHVEAHGEEPAPVASVAVAAAAEVPSDDPTASDPPTRSAAKVEPDAVGAAAVKLAQAAALAEALPGAVGDHLGLDGEGERVVTHYFACLSAGYRGWRWAVTVARAPRSRTATVSEVVLLPGADAVLAPVWLPWSDRIAPGDLGAADQLPYRADDPYLEPGLLGGDDPAGDAIGDAMGDAIGDPMADAGRDCAVDDAAGVARWELGLGRARVLSPLGRSAAVERWYLGDRGPTADEAVHAEAACSTCGYFVQLAGSLRQVFGVCANEWSPSDGRVVSVDHGCGAHSETDVEQLASQPLPAPILDETGADALVLGPRILPSGEPPTS